MYNTPPVFSIYALNLVLEWVQEQEALTVCMRKILEVFKIVYYLITLHFIMHWLMNRHVHRQTLSLLQQTLNEIATAKDATKEGLFNLSGHRSVVVSCFIIQCTTY